MRFYRKDPNRLLEDEYTKKFDEIIKNTEDIYIRKIKIIELLKTAKHLYFLVKRYDDFKFEYCTCTCTMSDGREFTYMPIFSDPNLYTPTEDFRLNTVRVKNIFGNLYFCDGIIINPNTKYMTILTIIDLMLIDIDFLMYCRFKLKNGHLAIVGPNYYWASKMQFMYRPRLLVDYID